MSDNVNHPEHYETGPFECIELSHHYSFAVGNAIKYVWRHQMKNGLEDLEKARWYLHYASEHGEEAGPVVGLTKAGRYVGVERLVDGCLDWPGFTESGAFWLALKQHDLTGMLRAVDALIRVEKDR